MTLHSGVTTGTPYSLSRYTDLPMSKWSWFQACLEAKKMIAFDPQTATPGVWSLDPKDTLGLVFWTKNPKNLIQHRARLDPYYSVLHITATGWSEVERSAPSLPEAGKLLVEASRLFEKVYWRFSPVPLLPQKELLLRFQRLLAYATIAKMDRVYVSLLQPNDQIPETRTLQERFDILNMLTEEARTFGVRVILCADDKSFIGWSGTLFQTEVCVQPKDFKGKVQLENCGCVLMVDPFTVNEACSGNCLYCYAADRTLSSHRRDTTAC
jgi:hypothetical protein